MLKKYILVLIISLSLFLSSCSDSKSNILEEIDKANYCEVSTDCELAASGICPFGCYVYVNINEVDKIKSLINNYKGENCAYSCIAISGVDCIDNKCTEKIS